MNLLSCGKRWKDGLISIKRTNETHIKLDISAICVCKILNNLLPSGGLNFFIFTGYEEEIGRNWQKMITWGMYILLNNLLSCQRRDSMNTTEAPFSLNHGIETTRVKKAGLMGP
jgi:hypothetical protein